MLSVKAVDVCCMLLILETFSKLRGLIIEGKSVAMQDLLDSPTWGLFTVSGGLEDWPDH